MKYTASVLIAAALVMASCAGSPAPTAGSGGATLAQATYPPKILEHQESAWGGEAPFWVSMQAGQIEEMPKYKDSYVFKMETVGAGSVDAAVTIGTAFDVLVPVAQQVSTRVQQKFGGSQVGDKEKLATYVENVVKILADAKFSGLRKEGQFWVRLQNFDSNGKPANQEYRVRFFYTIPKDVLDKQIAKQIDAADAAEPAKTEDERTARARVRELMASDI